MTHVGGVRTLAGLIDAYWKYGTSKEGRRVLCDLAAECNTGIQLSGAVCELFTSSTYGDMRFKRRKVRGYEPRSEGGDEPPSEGGSEQASRGSELTRDLPVGKAEQARRADLGLEERAEVSDVGSSGAPHSSAAALSKPCVRKPSYRPESPIIID